MQSVVKSIIVLLVVARRVCLVHRPIVVRNVLSIKTVHRTALAYGNVVRILALALAVLMPFAQHKITILYVHVSRVTKVTRMLVVIHRKVSTYFKFTISSCFLGIEQIPQLGVH